MPSCTRTCSLWAMPVTMSTDVSALVRLRWVLALGLSLLLGLACTEEPASVDETAPQGLESSEEGLEDLAAIGYAEFSSRGAADDLGAGVVLYDAERSVPGYNLYTSIPFSAAVLIDATGNEVHRWDDDCDVWTRARLLPDGDLLVIGVCRGDVEVAPFLARKRWDGSEVWRSNVSAHHDLDVLPDGRILVITKSRRERTGYGANDEVRDNELTLLSPAGEVLQQRSISDMIDAGPALFSWLGEDEFPGAGESKPFADFLHCNSLVWLTNTPLSGRDPLYASGNVLLSSRHQSSLLMVNFERGELLWSWGQGELQRQHEASVLPNGNILLFDNGTAERGFSRLVELDPGSGRIVWEYQADPPEEFFSEGRGTVQPLRGGNLLVGNSARGEAFEVTREGEVVWRFFNPDVREDGAHAVLRIERYPVEMIETLLRTVGGR